MELSVISVDQSPVYLYLCQGRDENIPIFALVRSQARYFARLLLLRVHPPTQTTQLAVDRVCRE